MRTWVKNISVDELRKNFDALILTGGACERRDLPAEGRELNGIHQGNGLFANAESIV